jgi:hypothetical protein
MAKRATLRRIVRGCLVWQPGMMSRDAKRKDLTEILPRIFSHKTSAKGGVINTLSRTALVLYPGIDRCPSFLMEVMLKIV